MLLGGPGLRTVDFDSAHIAPLPRPPLRPGEFVLDLISASQTYAVTDECTHKQPRILRIGADGRATVFPLSDLAPMVLADGPHAWGVTFPNQQHPNRFLVPLGGGNRIRLPTGFRPTAITNGVLIGNRDSTPNGPGSLLLVDASTGRVRANLGNGLTLAAGRGLVVWAEGCDPASTTKPCTVHRRSVAGGATSTYRLPRPPAFTAGVLSPDGRQAAFTLRRADHDPRYQPLPSPPPSPPLPPCDIAILHLDTGALEIVPGIEIPANGPRPGLAFSADARWLVITLNAGSRTQLLAWRAGLHHPYQSTPIAGPTWGTPPVAVLPQRTHG